MHAGERFQFFQGVDAIVTLGYTVQFLKGYNVWCGLLDNVRNTVVVTYVVQPDAVVHVVGHDAQVCWILSAGT